MKKFLRYFPITKIDEEERMVYGYASTPDLDSQGEIISLDAMTKAMPGYMQYPTIREMHQAKAAGTTKSWEVHKGKKKKGIYIGAKVVADDAWELVKEGVYKGFSIGGNVLQKVGNVIEELELVEISLVDVPANKAAKIEVWKAQDVNKNAYTVYSLSNLMIQLKDTIEYYKYLGKKTKKLEKMLEMIKEVIAQEAAEPEDDGSEKALVADGILKRAELLSKMTFTDDYVGKVANVIREGVIAVMKTKASQVDPETTDEDVDDDASTQEDVDTETTGDEAEGDETATTTEDQDTDTDSDDDADTKETSATATLKKITEVNKRLAKMAQDDGDDESAKMSVTKAVNAMAGTIAKMTSVIEGLEKRVASLEKNPAPTKSKAAYVIKGQDGEGDDKPTGDDSAELAAKKAQYADLEKKFAEMGPAKFAKAGLSTLAVKLQDEIARLEAKK